MSNCNHQPRQIGRDYGFTCSVARPPYTDENPAAHGCITYTQECTVCGAQREVNQNQGHHEYGTWGPDRATREREQRDRKPPHVARVDRARGLVQISIPGRPLRWYGMTELRAAASQYDNGDGLVQFYAALVAQAETLRA